MVRRPCWVEISTRAFEDNYRVLVEACGEGSASSVELLAIVKADAYGHGLSYCAPAAVRAGAGWLGVTSVEEGVAARALCTEAGYPDVQILVIGGPFSGQGAEVAGSRLTAVVWDSSQLDELEAAARKAGCADGSIAVHLELDTGMSRQGVAADRLESLLGRFRENSQVRLGGLMTHLYAAAVMAGEVMRDLRSLCARYGMKPMARPGLALYGLAPEFAPDEPESVAALRKKLQRVLEWKTRVVSVRSISAGQAIGYNGTFVATEPMRLALLAVGYADGLNRALSNRGNVLIGGQRAPIVGRISMDQTVVDVTEIPGVATGDEVVLLGRQGAASITAQDHAEWVGTISWEIFTSITARVERIKV